MSLEQLPFLSPEEQAVALERPALPPPEGVEPNFDNYTRYDTGGQAVLAICVIITTVSFTVRGYFRWFKLRKFDFSDVFLIASAGCFMGFIAVDYRFMIICGFYVHQWDVRLKDLWDILYIIHIGENLVAMTMMCLKVALVLEIMAMFMPSGKSRGAFYWMAIATLAVVCLWYLGARIAGNFHCIPHRRIWDLTVPGACYNWKLANLLSGIINLVTDVALLALPQGIIWRLNTTRSKRFGVSLVFAVGLLGCAAAAVRIAFNVSYWESSDQVYQLTYLLLAAVSELACGFFVIATPYFAKVFPIDELIKITTTTVRRLLSETSRRTGASGTRSGLGSNSAKQGQDNLPGASEHAYHSMDDSETGVPLSKLTPTNQYSIEGGGRTPNKGREFSGIRKTTDIQVGTEFPMTGAQNMSWDTRRP